MNPETRQNNSIDAKQENSGTGITIMTPDSTIIQKFGLVAVMDVLGVRNDNTEQSRILLEKIQAYKARCRDFRNDHCWKMLRDKISPSEYNNWDLIFKKESSLDIFFLGDTFVFAFPFPKDYLGNIGVLILKCIGLSSFFFTLAFEYDLFMRGACAIGDYLWADESTVLGPAITDAITWHDKANWIGLHLTPTAAFHYQRHCEGIDAQAGEHPIPYPIPLKQGRKRMLTVNWAPDVTHNWNERFDKAFRFRKKNVRKCFLDIIRNHVTIPYGVEDKYENTLEYFEFGIDSFEKEHSTLHGNAIKNLSIVYPEEGDMLWRKASPSKWIARKK